MSSVFPMATWLPFGKLQSWEVATWENTLGKVLLGKMPLGKFVLGVQIRNEILFKFKHNTSKLTLEIQLNKFCS